MARNTSRPNTCYVSPLLATTLLLFISTCSFHVANAIGPSLGLPRIRTSAQPVALRTCRSIWGEATTRGACGADVATQIESRSRAAALSTILRGGAMDESDEYDDESEYGDESESESEYDEEHDEYDDESEEDSGVESGVDADEEAMIEYDEQLSPSIVQQLGSTVGVMYLSRNIDLFNPKVVKTIRAALIAYAIFMQLFLAYVRIKAKTRNDRTQITVKNPMSSLLQKQLPAGDGGTNDMVKNIASQFLSSETTIMEYDLKEAKKMGNSLLFPLIFMWIVHFKFGQVQPLLFQLSSGLLNLVYSPLFQVYVLGRNLERPFKQHSNPMAEKMEEMQKQQQEQLKQQAESEEAAAAAAADEISEKSVEDAADEEPSGGESASEYDEEEDSESEEESSDYDESDED